MHQMKVRWMTLEIFKKFNELFLAWRIALWSIHLFSEPFDLFVLAKAEVFLILNIDIVIQIVKDMVQGLVIFFTKCSEILVGKHAISTAHQSRKSSFFARTQNLKIFFCTRITKIYSKFSPHSTAQHTPNFDHNIWK